jgi:hypothetical protein
VIPFNLCTPGKIALAQLLILITISTQHKFISRVMIDFVDRRLGAMLYGMALFYRLSIGFSAAWLFC